MFNNEHCLCEIVIISPQTTSRLQCLSSHSDHSNTVGSRHSKPIHCTGFRPQMRGSDLEWMLSRVREREALPVIAVAVWCISIALPTDSYDSYDFLFWISFEFIIRIHCEKWRVVSLQCAIWHIRHLNRCRVVYRCKMFNGRISTA